MLSLSPPWFLMSLGAWDSLFLCLLVGSFGMGLYVLVSDNNKFGFFCVVLPVHYNHGHTLICCQYHPGMVLFKFPNCLIFLQSEVGFGWEAFFLD